MIFRALKRLWLSWRPEFSRQLYFELLKMFGRRRTHLGFVVFVVLELLFAFLFMRESSVEWVQGMMERRVSKLGPLGLLIDLDYYYSALTMGHMILGVAVVLLGGLFLALVAGDIVSKEEEDGTLRMVLSRPVSRGRLLAVKYSACAVFTFALIGFAALSSLATGFIFWKSDGGFFLTSKDLDLTAFHKFGPGLWRYLLAIPFLALSMLVVTSLAFFFSCLRMKPATATILTLALLFIDIILKRMEPLQDIKHLFITSRMSSWQLVLARDVDWWLLAQNFLFLGAVCAVTFFLGWSIFSRRDFKS
jgi:ABC-2 type transport system permease protein